MTFDDDVQDSGASSTGFFGDIFESAKDALKDVITYKIDAGVTRNTIGTDTQDQNQGTSDYPNPYYNEQSTQFPTENGLLDGDYELMGYQVPKVAVGISGLVLFALLAYKVIK